MSFSFFKFIVNMAYVSQCMWQILSQSFEYDFLVNVAKLVANVSVINVVLIFLLIFNNYKHYRHNFTGSKYEYLSQ